MKNKNNNISIINVDACFIAIGHVPNTQLIEHLVDLDASMCVKKHEGDYCKTKTEGLFLAGDVQDNVYRQAITVAGLGY